MLFHATCIKSTGLALNPRGQYTHIITAPPIQWIQLITVQWAFITSSLYINRIMMFVCLFVCLSDRSLTTFQRKELSTCGFLQMNLTLRAQVRTLIRNRDDVIKGVKYDVIVTSSGLYGAKNALFGTTIVIKW